MNYRKQAVALAYGSNPTPIVTAKGDGELAQRILQEARENGVLIAEDAQLVQLLSKLQVDQEIPTELYTAVAVVLSWVYWLKGMRPGDEKKGQNQDQKREEDPAVSA
jgi:flagellar biosynthesis protein